MSKVITLAMLIENEACEEQFDLFQEYFGESVEITEELYLKYYDEFDIEFITTNFLNDSQKKVYLAIQGPAWEAYEAIEGPAYEAYKAIKGPAWKAYEAIEGPAWEAYKKEQAKAFCVAYNS